MSVPPAGGEGTMMRTGRTGYSACASAWHAQKQSTKLAHRMQYLSVALGGLRRHEDESDDAGLGAHVHPVVQRRLLHERIAGAQLDHRIVEMHLDLARDHHSVVDGLGAVPARCDARLVAHSAEDRAVGAGPRDAARAAGPT